MGAGFMNLQGDTTEGEERARREKPALVEPFLMRGMIMNKSTLSSRAEQAGALAGNLRER